MKIIAENKKLRFIPENDKDCFDLGRFSKEIGHTLKMTSNTDNPKPEINVMEVSINELWSLLVRIINKNDNNIHPVMGKILNEFEKGV